MPRTMRKGFKGELLRQLREDNYMSTTYVAEKIGIANSSSISRWERGLQTPRIKQVEKLARLFGMTLTQFYYKKDKVTA